MNKIKGNKIIEKSKIKVVKIFDTNNQNQINRLKLEKELPDVSKVIKVGYNVLALSIGSIGSTMALVSLLRGK